jgi:hypothetical protein
MSDITVMQRLKIDYYENYPTQAMPRVDADNLWARISELEAEIDRLRGVLREIAEHPYTQSRTDETQYTLGYKHGFQKAAEIARKALGEGEK